jgi:pilus assembly protein Flp/PilA
MWLVTQQVHHQTKEDNMNFLNEMYVKFQTAVKSDKGQTLVEYALLLVLIAIVVILMVKGIGGSANNTFSKVNSALQ